MAPLLHNIVHTACDNIQGTKNNNNNNNSMMTHTRTTEASPEWTNHPWHYYEHRSYNNTHIRCCNTPQIFISTTCRITQLLLQKITWQQIPIMWIQLQTCVELLPFPFRTKNLRKFGPQHLPYSFKKFIQKYKIKCKYNSWIIPTYKSCILITRASKLSWCYTQHGTEPVQ